MPEIGVKRKAREIPVPARGEDAAERKRVLNVLAQRRYRKRRREHVKKLEAHAVASTSNEDPGPSGSESDPSDAARPSQYPPASRAPALAAATSGTVQLSDLQIPAYAQHQPDFEDPFFALDPNFVTTIQEDWASLLPSLPGTPFSPSDSSDSQIMSLTSISSPATSKSPNTPYSFPDEAHLNILELDMLRGATAIATRLNINHLIWSLDTTSPFTDPSMALAQFDHLPKNLRPTVAQMTQPHHPVLDLLPWPKVREKLILIFSQPAELRPPSAASPMALVEFVYDIEDSAEGVRIWGDDPYSDQNWEVGEKVFKNWWWAFDSDVIRRSNEMRKSRGAKLLGEGTILGEVA